MTTLTAKALALSFTVPGRPVPKVRMTQRSKFSDKAQACLAYQDMVRRCAWLAAKEAKMKFQHDAKTLKVRPLFEGPVAITLAFRIAKRRGTPDIDNLAKSILDGLQPQIIGCDNVLHVPELHISSVYGVPADEQGVDVTIEAASEERVA